MMPFVVKGETWNVLRVKPGDTRLIDRTGTSRIATTDPLARAVYIDENVMPPLLDKVLLHEVAHAMTVSYNLLGYMRAIVPKRLWIPVEEWAVSMIEDFGIEATLAASESLGRPLCIRGFCMKGM